MLSGENTPIHAGRILLKKLRNTRTSLENTLEYSVEKQLPRSIPILAVLLKRRIWQLQLEYILRSV